MTNIKIHIDPEELPKSTTNKFKNFKKIDNKVSRFYTISGIRIIYKKNRLLFVLLFLFWLMTLVWIIAE